MLAKCFLLPSLLQSILHVNQRCLNNTFNQGYMEICTTQRLFVNMCIGCGSNKYSKYKRMKTLFLFPLLYRNLTLN